MNEDELYIVYILISLFVFIFFMFFLFIQLYLKSNGKKVGCCSINDDYEKTKKSSSAIK